MENRAGKGAEEGSWNRCGTATGKSREMGVRKGMMQRLRASVARFGRETARFGRETDGNILMMSGFLVPVAVLGAAVAVDTAEIHRAKTNFQQALDAGTLIAAKIYTDTGKKDDALKAGRQTFTANLSNLPRSTGTMNVQFPDNCEDGDIIGTATGEHPLWFAPIHKWFDNDGSQVAQEGKFPIKTTSNVNCPNSSVEVAMVLDNSGSMSGSKLSTLKRASKELVDTLFEEVSSQRRDPVKFSLVPFAGMVNVGRWNRNASWMDRQGKSSIHHKDLDWSWDTDRRNPRQVGTGWQSGGNWLTRFNLFDDLKIQWGGCVQMRPWPYHSADTPPNTSNPDTLFVPAFAPDEPENLRGQKHQKREVTAAEVHCVNWKWRRNRSRYECDTWSDGRKGRRHPQMGFASWNDGVRYRRGVYIGPMTTTVVNESANIGNEDWYYNDYIDDGKNMPTSNKCQGLIRHRECSGTDARQHVRQGFTFKYKDATTRDDIPWSGGYKRSIDGYFGPNFMCTTRPVVALTGNRGNIKRELDRMGASGYTNVAQGTAWGWRTLSPGAPYTNGRAYGDIKNQKFMIVLTDGAHTYHSPPGWASKRNVTSYGAFGYGRHHSKDVKDGFMFEGFPKYANPNPGNGNTRREAMDYHLVQTCEAARQTGITIYTIAFDVANGSSIHKTLNACASARGGGGRYYYKADDNAALLATFRQIADSIKRLRLTK